MEQVTSPENSVKDEYAEIAPEAVQPHAQASGTISSPPNTPKTRVRSKRRDNNSALSPEGHHQPRKTTAKIASTPSSSSAPPESAVNAEPGESDQTSSITRRKRRIKRARTSAEHNGGNEEQSSFLVEMEDMGNSHDEEEVARDEEMAISSAEQRRNIGCCAQTLVDTLKVLASSWLHFALVLLPFPIIIYAADWHQGVLFIFSYLTLFPLSSLLVRSKINSNCIFSFL